MKHLLLTVGMIAAVALPAHAQYQTPPEPLLSVLRAPLTPTPTLDPSGRTLLLVQQAPFPSIARVAEPYVKLAGVRVETRTHTRHDMASGYGIRTCLDGFALLDIKSARQSPVSLPAGACPSWPRWSADGSHFAFGNTTDQGVELWIGESASGKLRRIEGVRLNTILGSELQWLGARQALMVKLIPADLGAAPAKSAVPPGPEIKESVAGAGESSTYEARDTLSSAEDEALFDHYATSQLAVVELRDDTVRRVGQAGVHAEVAVAPDGRHVRVETLKRPYSYVTTWERFAHEVAVIDLEHDHRYLIADLPVADSVPVRGVPEGPRDFAWRANEPATLIFAEALDAGDWKNTVPARDRILQWRARFRGKPTEIARTVQRFGGLSWLEGGKQAVLSEYDINRRWYRSVLVDAAKPERQIRVLWDLSMDDRYGNPGSPLWKSLPNGYSVVRQEGNSIFLSGSGATPGGDRPFLDRFDLGTGKSERLFRSSADALESMVDFAGDTRHFYTWHQSPRDVPNLHLRTLGPRLAQVEKGEAGYASERSEVTRFPDPTPLVREVRKKLVTYRRRDGVELSFTLYTPPGYKQGERLPAILYAYPADYADASMAGQVRGSENTFTRLSNYRTLLLAGYAIIDNASFPIVGDPKNAYDTYLEQLVDDAMAAVDKAVELGVVDRERIGVTGHSHGALMTANLLAHTDLFRAGVASSGGYNKTLTPFGFQNERRSYWKAPQVYDQASSFFHADKIDEPILIVHGSDDANPGTEVTQSPRLFQAVRGNGGTARLVMLPFEPHWYTARESNEHFVAEMLAWFDKYVKNAAPRTATPAN
ncbi:alpha/beta hydrolase family protein [Chiayiivirga sp.]|jgi:dipeptidyl aminopeptidase/acylaminoacyl peptidase|uniref:alpha/beta hydrolase family protein n=1 Tax=Chiayiivirga sp. TaxID=2041042 RepID=UPI003DA9A3A5